MTAAGVGEDGTDCEDGKCFSAVCLPTKQPQHGDHCWVAGYGHKKHGVRKITHLRTYDKSFFS